MSTKNSEIKPFEYACNGKILSFASPLVMAIVNITPDSFYDGGKYSSATDVLRDIQEKTKQGAHIIDIGAASSRPGASGITAGEEWMRLSALLPLIRKEFPGVFLSVDTFHAGVAEKSAAEGADIINDISGGKYDPLMFETVARLDLPYVCMHIDGTPQTMQQNPPYQDVVTTVRSFFESVVEKFKILQFEKIILDPGFSFGKSLENNYQMLRSLGRLSVNGLPVLAGISRKSMINRVIGTNPVTALNGTTVLNTIALLNGASILRVHDVKEAMEAISLVQFYRNA